MINLKIKTNGTVRNLTLPYPGQSIPDIIEKNSVVTVSEVTEPESLKYMEGHEWNIEEINFLAKRTEPYTEQEVNISIVTQPESTPMNSPRSISSAADFLANHSPSAESDGDLTTQEVRSFMKSCAWLKPGCLNIFCLKTCRGFSTTTAGRPSALSSERYMSWGIVLNGACLTARISEFPKPEKADIKSQLLQARSCQVDGWLRKIYCYP